MSDEPGDLDLDQIAERVGDLFVRQNLRGDELAEALARVVLRMDGNTSPSPKAIDTATVVLKVVIQGLRA